MLSAVKVLRTQKERAQSLLPARLHHYLDERILPASWYSFDEHIELLRAIATLTGAPAPWVMMGRGTARMDFGGIYRNRLREGDAVSTLRAMAAMWKSGHDTGELTVVLDEGQRATMRLHGFVPRSNEICGICTGYLVEVVFMALHREPRVEHSQCRNRGGQDCVWTVDWTA